MSKTEVGASIPERLETVGMENPDALIQALSAILTQRLETIDRQITVLSGMIERLENRLTEDENNYGRALALLEDRIRDLETRHTKQVCLLGRLSGRLHTVEGQELNEIDERLCRLEAAGVGVSK